MRDEERCAATDMSGGRGYAARRCNKRAMDDDPERLCRHHRLERDGHRDTGADAERRWRVLRDRERRLTELARHLGDFYRLPVVLEYDAGERSRPCTGRLLVDPEDLLRVLHAQDLMPQPQPHRVF